MSTEKTSIIIISLYAFINSLHENIFYGSMYEQQINHYKARQSNNISNL